ncbi:unnamed protein product [Hymenolepis diminuta]|nr:unnamed protein product [Hymenolepis diminuta]
MEVPGRHRHTSEAQSTAPSSLPESVRSYRCISAACITAAPEGWAPSDAASYWCSQVEESTHQGPFRRIWMGPQFTFRSYPFESGEMPKTDSFLYKPTSSSNPCLSPSVIGGQCACTCSGGVASISASSLNEALCFADPRGDSSGAQQTPFCCESYHGSSLGGSLCSLTSRGYDGVAHSLAEAMQDDDSLARSAQQQLFLGGQQQQLNLITPSPMLINRSHSPAIGNTISSKLLSGKRDSLFLCESDFPEVESSAPAPISEKIESPTPLPNLPFPMDEPEIHTLATSEVATSLPFKMNLLGGTPFSEGSLSSSPSKSGACSLGGGVSGLQMSTSSKKTKKARKKASAKQKQLQEQQQKGQETEESPNASSINMVMSTSVTATMTRRDRRSSSKKAAAEEKKEVSASPPKKSQQLQPQSQWKQQKLSPKESSPSGLSLNRSISDEDDDDNNGGWAAEIERYSPY